MQPARRRAVEVVSRGRDGLELLKQRRCQLDSGLLPENREGLPALSDLHRQDLADDLQVLAEFTDHLPECVGRLKLGVIARRARIVAGGGDRERLTFGEGALRRFGPRCVTSPGWDASNPGPPRSGDPAENQGRSPYLETAIP